MIKILTWTLLTLFVAAPALAQDCFDYASGESPPAPGSLSLGMRIGDVAVAGDRAAVAAFEYFDAQVLHVYWLDCSEPAGPVELADVAFGAGGLQWHQRVRLAGDRVYLNRSRNDTGVVYCVDFSDPQSPAVNNLLLPGQHPVDLAVVGDVVWLACGSAGLLAWDYADSASPQPLGTLTGLDGDCRYVEPLGDHLVVATAMTLYVVDGQDPTAPQIVGSVASPGYINGRLAAHGDHVHFVDGPMNLLAADVSDPAAPVFAGTPLAPRPGAWGPGTLAAQGERLYHADGNGVRVLDISDPDAPAEVGALDSGSPMWLDVRPGALYFADYNSGTLRVALPDCEDSTPAQDAPAPAVASLAVHPNPFNPQTVIRLWLPEAQRTRVTLHDVRGRLLRELAGGEFTAGEHEIVWRGDDDRGRDLGSGVYLVWMEGERDTASARLVMLR